MAVKPTRRRYGKILETRYKTLSNSVPVRYRSYDDNVEIEYRTKRESKRDDRKTRGDESGG